MKEFFTRTLTAVFLLIFAFAAIEYLPDLAFSLLIFFIIILTARELISLTKPFGNVYLPLSINSLLIAAYYTFGIPGLSEVIFAVVFITGLHLLLTTRDNRKLENYIRDFGIQLLIAFYLIFPLYFLLLLRRLGPNYLFFLIFVIAVGDSGAYFIGKPFGNHKIYPVASPNKSFEGIIAAIVTAGIFSYFIIRIFPVDGKLSTIILTGALIGLVSQVSDPVESLFKRAANKKDSGSILPGHGGFFDRVDSYIFCAPLLYFIVLNFWR